MADYVTEFIHMDILYNGLDFLLYSVLPPVSDEVSEYMEDDMEYIEILPKYAVLNLAAAVELILKARLCKEHWSLIFQSPDKASPEALRSGNFTTVNFDTCIKRLKGIANISIPQNISNTLYELRAQRNIYQHFRIAITPTALEAIPLTARCLDAVLDIIDTWFETGDFYESSKEAIEILRPRLSSLDRFREHRLMRLKSRLANIKTLRCPICGEETLEANPINKCLFCHWQKEATAVATMIAIEEEADREAREHQLTLFDMPPRPHAKVGCCPRCGSKALLVRSRYQLSTEILSLECYECGFMEYE